MSKSKQSQGEFSEYDSIRSTLERVREEFENAAQTFPDLFFERILAPFDDLEDEAWDAFISAHSTNTSWEHWSHGDHCRRWYGNQRLFDGFCRLAESAMAILTHLEVMSQRIQPVPTGFRLDLCDATGLDGWMEMVYETAFLNTTFLRIRSRHWNLPENLDLNQRDQLHCSSWTELNNGVRIPNHPFCMSLQNNVFRSSADAIGIWLNPHNFPTIGDMLADSPAFLPPATNGSYSIRSTVGNVAIPQASDEVNPSEKGQSLWREMESIPDSLRPRYVDRKLFAGETLIKHFKQPQIDIEDRPQCLEELKEKIKKNQECLVIDFEIRKWPQCVPIPTIPHAWTRTTIYNTLFDLNSVQEDGPIRIRFRKIRRMNQIKWTLLKRDD